MIVRLCLKRRSKCFCQTGTGGERPFRHSKVFCSHRSPAELGSPPATSCPIVPDLRVPQPDQCEVLSGLGALQGRFQGWLNAVIWFSRSAEWLDLPSEDPRPSLVICERPAATRLVPVDGGLRQEVTSPARRDSLSPNHCRRERPSSAGHPEFRRRMGLPS